MNENYGIKKRRKNYDLSGDGNDGSCIYSVTNLLFRGNAGISPDSLV